jgi:capsid protein
LFSETKKAFPLGSTSDRFISTSRHSQCGEAARFFWDGMEHVDPIKEAKAAASRIDSRISNLAIECAKVGLDWEDVLVQSAREKNRMLELGLTPSEGSPDNTEMEEEDEEIETDESDIGSSSHQTRRTKHSRKKSDES